MVLVQELVHVRTQLRTNQFILNLKNTNVTLEIGFRGSVRTFHMRSVAIKKDCCVGERHVESNSTLVLGELHTMERLSRGVEA